MGGGLLLGALSESLEGLVAEGGMMRPMAQRSIKRPVDDSLENGCEIEEDTCYLTRHVPRFAMDVPLVLMRHRMFLRVCQATKW